MEEVDVKTVSDSYASDCVHRQISNVVLLQKTGLKQVFCHNQLSGNLSTSGVAYAFAAVGAPTYMYHFLIPPIYFANTFLVCLKNWH